MNHESVTIRSAHATDAAAVAEIYNQSIHARIATFETRERGAAELAERIADTDWPLLVSVAGGGRVFGWAGLSAYRPRPCYAGIAEFSIYLDTAARGQGHGRALLEALVSVAAARGFWKLVSRIFPENGASRALCRHCGFREVGTYEKHGLLDGRWRDVVIVERLIPESLDLAANAAASAASA